MHGELMKVIMINGIKKDGLMYKKKNQRLINLRLTKMHLLELTDNPDKKISKEESSINQNN
jgi:hypothetical protein